MSFRGTAWALPAAFAAHVAEEAPGFTAWARRNASPRYSQRDFTRINAFGLALTTAATLAITISDSRRLALAYYSLIASQQLLFNAIFHATATVAYREYSPGLVTSVLSVPLWKRLTRAGLAERRITHREALAGAVAGGVLHALVVARQVFFVGVR